MIRALFAFVVLGFSAIAAAAGLAGTFSMPAQQGSFVANLDVRGSSVSGKIDLAGRGLLQLTGTANGNRARGTISAYDGNGVFEAEVNGDLLVLTIAQPDGPYQRAGRSSFQFQRVQASSPSPSAGAATAGASRAGGSGDNRLIGNWVSQSLITSGSASMASEQFMSFRADGSYSYGKGRSVAGGVNWSYDGGRGQGSENGRWRASDGVLYMLDQNGQWSRVGKYGFTDDLSTMRITYDRGGKKLWSRR